MVLINTGATVIVYQHLRRQSFQNDRFQGGRTPETNVFNMNSATRWTTVSHFIANDDGTEDGVSYSE